MVNMISNMRLSCGAMDHAMDIIAIKRKIYHGQ